MMEIEKFINKLDELISVINSELENRKKGIAGDGEIFELEHFFKEFSDLKETLKKNILPPKEFRHLYAPRTIVDSGSFDIKNGTIMSKKIMEINELYKKL